MSIQQQRLDTTATQTPAGLKECVNVNGQWVEGRVKIIEVPKRKSLTDEYLPVVGAKIAYDPFDPETQAPSDVDRTVGRIQEIDYGDSELPINTVDGWGYRRWFPRFRQDTVHKVIELDDGTILYLDVMDNE